MLMVLPVLDAGVTDFASRSGIRELFWFGRSSCNYDPNLTVAQQLCEEDSSKVWI